MTKGNHPRPAVRRRVVTIGVMAAGALALASSGLATAAPPTAWSHTATIRGHLPYGLGGDVALSGDGNVLVAAGRYEVIYTRAGTRWVARATLPSGAGPVAISTNGATLAIGTYRTPAEVAGPLRGGAVLVYTRRGNAWVRTTTLRDPNFNLWDEFGTRLALSADGSTLLTGSTFTQYDTEAADFFYVRVNGTWKLAQTIRQPIVGQTAFGGGVLSANGRVALLNWDDGSNFSGTGHTTTATFVRSGATWSQQGPLFTQPGNLGGSQAAGISADGATAVITTANSGASYQDQHTGRAVILRRVGTTWNQQQVISVPATSGVRYIQMTPPALSADGHTLLIGSRSQFAGRGTTAVYTDANGTWMKTATLAAPGPEATGGDYGVQVTISATGTTAAVGETSAYGSAGAVGVYSLRVVLTHAQWTWLHDSFIPRHFAPRLRAGAWSSLTSRPTLAYALVERDGPPGIR